MKEGTGCIIIVDASILRRIIIQFVNQSSCWDLSLAFPVPCKLYSRHATLDGQNTRGEIFQIVFKHCNTTHKHTNNGRKPRPSFLLSTPLLPPPTPPPSPRHRPPQSLHALLEKIAVSRCMRRLYLGHLVATTHLDFGCRMSVGRFLCREVSQLCFVIFQRSFRRGSGRWHFLDGGQPFTYGDRW